MKDILNSVLVDDEDNCLTALRLMIEKNCPNIHILGEAKSVNEGISLIDEASPDLVFLDIKMPDGEGFDVLEQVESKDFNVIITTASKDYALKAYEFSAIDYLLKPINHLELKSAVDRVSIIKPSELFNHRVQLIREAKEERQKRIMLPTSDGFEIFMIDKIIRCESDGCYTNFYFKDEQNPIMVSNNIGTYENLFSDLNFFRIHNRHLVNLNYVKKYTRRHGGFVIIKDSEKTELKVSDRKKVNFLERMKLFARG